MYRLILQENRITYVIRVIDYPKVSFTLYILQN